MGKRSPEDLSNKTHDQILGVRIPRRGAMPHDVPRRLADHLRSLMTQEGEGNGEKLARALQREGVTPDQVEVLQGVFGKVAQKLQFADLRDLMATLTVAHRHMVGPTQLPPEDLGPRQRARDITLTGRYRGPKRRWP